MNDNSEFLKIQTKILAKQPLQGGIGTLKEKALHVIVKEYLQPDTACHEVKIGRFVADVFCDGEIIEIQTRSFGALKKKLAYFLEEHTVTVAHPIPHTKWIFWLNEETGELSPKRKSPKDGAFFDVFYELAWIKPFLSHPRFSLHLLLLDVEEYRLLNGWSADKKKGSTRFDRIPTRLVEELVIKSSCDYEKLLPPHLPQPFTVKDFQKAAHRSVTFARKAIDVLVTLEVVARAGKQGRSYLYLVNHHLKSDNPRQLPLK